MLKIIRDWKNESVSEYRIWFYLVVVHLWCSVSRIKNCTHCGLLYLQMKYFIKSHQIVAWNKTCSVQNELCCKPWILNFVYIWKHNILLLLVRIHVGCWCMNVHIKSNQDYAICDILFTCFLSIPYYLWCCSWCV